MESKKTVPELADNLEKPKEEEDDAKENSAASFRELFQFATGWDYCLIVLGIFGATISGFGWPVLAIIFGEIVNVFAEFQFNINNSSLGGNNATMDQIEEKFMKDVYLYSGYMAIDTVAFALGNLINIYCFQIFSLRQIRVIKRKYFDAILRQEIAWHDRQSSGEFASRLASDFKKLETGINENFGLLLFDFAGAAVNLVAGFVYGWKLSLAILSMAPVMAIVSYVMSKLQARFMQKELASSSAASSAAEEVISAIRTVFAFSGQNRERERYETLLKPAMNYGCKRNFVTAIGTASTWGIMFSGFAFGLWIGVKLIISSTDDYTIGSVVIVFWAITGVGFNFGAAAPYIETLQNARAAAGGIFKVIARQSAIDSLNSEGNRLKSNFNTDIEFKNVHFGYPTRSEVRILKGLDLKINSGEVVALVGSSGCGKSTMIQLLQRFYDTDDGEILLDGVNIRQLNVGWLREQLGVVGQEPVLFDDSIEQNIKLGMPIEKLDMVTKEDIENAAKEANAHEFIKRLPEGYATYVGDRGAQLSGGQKQRIAIARALLSRPRILLLDEATSALDLRSEHVVQTALDRASKGRTTIIIAHRLSTIQGADRIIYLNDGKVFEMGTHDELMAKKSAYYKLVMAQQTGQDVIELPTDDSTGNANQRLNCDPSILRTKSNSRSESLSSNNLAILQSNANQLEELNEDELKLLKSSKFPYFRLLKLIWNDKIYFMIACFTALMYGLSTPVYALIFGGFVQIFADSHDPEYWNDQTPTYSYLFLALAAAMFTACTLQITFFGIVGEKLTMKLRLMAYSAMLNQEIGWFDRKENSAGALCSRLADDVANIQGATGLRVAMMCQALSTLVISISIGFYYSWRLAIVSLILMPIIAIASIASASIYSTQASKESKTTQKSSKMTIEVLNAFRTVTSMHKEKYFFERFVETLVESYNEIAGKAFRKALVIGISLSASMFAYTIAILYGGYLIKWRYLNSGDFFRIVESMVAGAMVVGQTAILSADFSKAKLAALSIFKLIDRKPIKLYTEQAVLSEKPISDSARSEGNIHFCGIHFNYPSRPDTTILNGLSFSASKGETVALVGSSGCGKSTSLQLLERFYDFSNGKILLDSQHLNQLNVDWVRSQMALVSQEPILFSYSIKENIAYGDNSRSEVPFDEIVRAAQMANIHEFIQELPKGYDTPVGGKGSQLSGGQKQRVAIARALIRNPPILLLDEATSALDTESEKVVQQALDQASQGRTCIVIAHRLQTILGADKIVVINQGENIEEGTHEELFAKKGHYWKLYNSAQ